jgi:hypothetical protein
MHVGKLDYAKCKRQLRYICPKYRTGTLKLLRFIFHKIVICDYKTYCRFNRKKPPGKQYTICHYVVNRQYCMDLWLHVLVSVVIEEHARNKKHQSLGLVATFYLFFSIAKFIFCLSCPFTLLFNY